MCGIRGVGGVCIARGAMGGEWGEWMRGLGIHYTNPVGTGGVDWKFWWAIGRHFNGLPPGELK